MTCIECCEGAASCPCDCHNDEQVGDPLIAAAPDLLAALKAICENENGIFSHLHSDVRARAEAAIAKAEGR